MSFGSAVPVTPGAQYFLVFESDGTTGCLAGDTENPYFGGQVYANSGFEPFPGFDFAFRTYGTDRAACGAPDQTQLDQSTCMANFSQTDLAQSFTAGTTEICGARVDVREGSDSNANITIGLWTALPNQGGVLLASGTDFGVPAGGAAIVDFGEAVPVMPGAQYFLVFTATNGNPCLAGDTANPLPGGNVFANAGYLPFPDYDYTFEVYGGGCASGCCPADLTGPGGGPDGNVDALDFLALIAQWGTPCGAPCTADLTGPGGAPDGNVDALDFLLIIAQWGSPAACQ